MLFRILMNLAVIGFAQEAFSSDASFEKFKSEYRSALVSDAQALVFLNNYLPTNYTRALSVDDQSQYFELVSKAFENLDCPFLALHFLKLSLEANPKPYSLESQRLWESVSRLDKKSHYLPQLMEFVLLLNKKRKGSDQINLPQEFMSTWAYLQGLVFSHAQKFEEAEHFFSQLHVGDRYFMAAQYQWALNELHSELDPAGAAIRFKSLVADELQEAVRIDSSTLETYKDQARLSIARIQFERQNYESAAKYYRQVNRTGRAFFDALNEQAWAFFLAGYPNHALGALHSATSPLYNDRFNPEAPLLRAMIYYWMCRYTDARSALSDFVNTYRQKLNQFAHWHKTSDLTVESAGKLFENFVSGVSSDTLGIDRGIVEQAASSGQMIEARQHLSLYLRDLKRLKKIKEFKINETHSFLSAEISRMREVINKQVGNALINELKGLEEGYGELISQADFLGIELLMSEKEQAQGSELHANQKLGTAERSLAVKGWGQGELPWKASAKGEYWSDELGFYVYQAESQCVEK